MLETPQIERFFEHTRKDFDYIIVDTSPVAIVTDALLIFPYTDLILFIIRQNYSSKNVIPYIDELYEKQNLKKLALVVNDIKLSSHYGYSYSYGYGYGYGYSQGYYEEETKTVPFLRKVFHLPSHK